MEPSTKANLTDRSKWVRILYMVFFAVAYAVAELLFWLVTLFQAVVVLLTGRANEAALTFGHNLSVYVYQIVQFETFNDEYLPFPFNDWPEESPAEGNVWRAPVTEEPSEPARAADASEDTAADKPAPDAGDDADRNEENPDKPSV